MTHCLVWFSITEICCPMERVSKTPTDQSRVSCLKSTPTQVGPVVPLVFTDPERDEPEVGSKKDRTAIVSSQYSPTSPPTFREIPY